MKLILYILLTFIIYITPLAKVSAQNDWPIFHLGVGGIYNRDLGQLAPHVRLDVPIFPDVEVSLQGNYYTTKDKLNGFQEYYTDLNINLYFYEYANEEFFLDLYIFGGYSYEYWINSRNLDGNGNAIPAGPAGFHGFNIGAGGRNYLNPYMNVFSDIRYYTNFKEVAVTLGLQFSFYPPKKRGRGPKERKIGKYNYWACPEW